MRIWRWRYSLDDILFMIGVFVFAVAGIMAGLSLPWYSLLILTIVCFFVEVVAVITLDQYRSGSFHTAVAIGVPIMVVLWWVVFALAIGIRP